MACFSMRRPNQTVEQRRVEVKKAVAKLEAQLAAGIVRLKVGPQGAVTFLDWKERDDVTDVCAFRQLQASGSAALRMALARAEALAGRSIDTNVINAGTHSHDGGLTWGGH